MNNETYFSTDIETDGPIPGPHSMLSFASVAYSSTGHELGRFTRNLTLLPGAAPDSSTQEFWSRNPEAYQATRTDTMDPKWAVPEYVRWVKSYQDPVFVGYPASFDFMFMYWYMIRFAGESPFSFSALDIKTAASVVLGLPYRQSTKRHMPKEWFRDATPHTHVALDDAAEQGTLFFSVMKAASRLRGD